MNCFNSERFLVEAIESVFAQTFADWEIVFWDNLSSDGSAAIAKRYQGKLRYFRGTRHLSLGAARNEALSRTRGDYVSLLDCDDLWPPEKLAEQVAVLEAKPDIGLVYSNCAFIDEHGRQFTTYFDRVRPAAADGDIRMALLTGRNFIASPAVLIRRSVLERLGGFNEALHDAEDYELWVRIAGSSRVGRLDKPLAKWRLHGRNTTGFGSPRTTLEIMQVIRAGTLGAGLSLRDRCAVALRMGILRAKLVVLCLRRGELRMLLVQGLLGLFSPLHLGAAPPLAARRHE